MEIYITERTCGQGCWHAKEDVCHCSCGGKNHGCLRNSDGYAPVRTSKLDGILYELKAISIYNGDLEREADKLNVQAGLTESACTSRDPWNKKAPAKVRKASASQIKAWPELSAWRGKTESELYFEGAPYLLWLKP